MQSILEYGLQNTGQIDYDDLDLSRFHNGVDSVAIPHYIIIPQQIQSLDEGFSQTDYI